MPAKRSRNTITQVAQSTRKINPGCPIRRPISAKLRFLRRVGTTAATINKKGARNQAPRLFKLLCKSLISKIVTTVTHIISIKRGTLVTIELSSPLIKTFYPLQNRASGSVACHCQILSLSNYPIYIMCLILCYIVFRLRVRASFRLIITQTKVSKTYGSMYSITLP